MFKINLYPFLICILLTTITTGILNEVKPAGENCDDPNLADADGYCKPNKNQKRYILYNINHGEGFNLRRDIYIRIAPLVNLLNDKNNSRGIKWILVLPPWGSIPHWNQKLSKAFYPWSKYFNLSTIQSYVEAIEFHDFLDENDIGHEDVHLDAVFQLQHFPLNSDGPQKWEEKIEVGVECENPLQFHLDQKDKSIYTRSLWGHSFISKSVNCMGLNGHASTIQQFLAKTNYKSVLFERAEVILWEHYADVNWWRARKSLQFANNLIEYAQNFIQNEIVPATATSDNFISAHLRRKDFLYGKRLTELPTMKGAANQIIKEMKRLQISAIFCATDAEEKNLYILKSEIEKHPNVKFFTYLCTLSEGECAVIDQIICTLSTYFIGTKDSTFTLRIFEEREILGFDSDSTFNVFCSDDVDIKCIQPTKWKIPENI